MKNPNIVCMLVLNGILFLTLFFSVLNCASTPNGIALTNEKIAQMKFDKSRIRNVLDNIIRVYKTRDCDLFRSLYAEDSLQRDPMGLSSVRGRDPIHKTCLQWLEGLKSFDARVIESYVVHNTMAAIFTLHNVSKEGCETTYNEIVTIVVNENYKILRVEAYWDMDAFMPAYFCKGDASIPH